MPVAYGLPLSPGPENLVDQTRDTIHFDHVLDILFLAESLKGQIKLLLPLDAFFDPLITLHAFIETAASVGQKKEEEARTEAYGELTPTSYTPFENFNSATSTIRQITMPVMPLQAIYLPIKRVKHRFVLLECMESVHHGGEE